MPLYNYNKTATERMDDHYRQNSDVQHFLQKYEATAGLSQKYYRRYHRMSYTDWCNQGSPIPLTTEAESEPMIEMTIPQDRFRDLIEQDEYVTKLEQERDYNQNIVSMLRADERVRWNNPSVDKAYKKYLMLLELARK